MNILHAYRLSNLENGLRNQLDDLTSITQLLSVLKLRLLNPNSKVILHTDLNTLEQYQSLGLDKVYDEVITDVMESYPEDEIAGNKYWASPKLWVMKHQTEPFIMVDTDMVLHLPIEDTELGDFCFLHTETSTSYPFPTILDGDYNWPDNLLAGFRNSLPMNCAIVGFNNMEFLKKYIDIYFDVVLGHSGEYKEATSDYTSYLHEYGAQITMEQWLLAALSYAEGLRGVSLTNAISFPDEFTHQVYNLKDEVLQELNNSIFHLWGAKAFYDKGRFDEWLDMKDNIIKATADVINSGNLPQEYFDILENLENYCRKVPERIN